MGKYVEAIKPVHITEGDEFGNPIFDYVVCPVCNEILNRYNGAYEIDFVPYCPKCGQHIDWGDEE